MSTRGAIGTTICLVAACASPDRATPPSASARGAAACGDGVRQGDEGCDRDDLASATCASVVATGATGTLRCSPFCAFDTRECSPHVACGAIGGVQPGAPWPLLGRCAAHPARSETKRPVGGTPAWSRAGAFLGSPVIGSDGTLYVGTADGGGHALSAIAPDGTLRWSVPTRPIQGSGAILAGGAIVIGEERTPAGEGSLLAIGQVAEVIGAWWKLSAARKIGWPT